MKITPYLLPGQREHDSILIFPGGGYEHLSLQKEGADVAAAFNREGFSAFVAEYRVSPYRYPAILDDAVRAVRTVRHKIGKNSRLALMGFSAGGHLALMEAQHWQEIQSGNDEISRENGRPDALILCYPVVTFHDPYAHSGSRMNFLGPENAGSAEWIDRFSAEKHISTDFPPAFLWHCESDRSVPKENSLMLQQALDAAEIPNKMLLFPGGAHGLGLAPNEPEISRWFPECVTWLKGLFAQRSA